MIILKPFVRITLLSTILASLLIYLGIKYHWGDFFKPSKPTVIELTIPDSTTLSENTSNTDTSVINNNQFDIVNDSNEISTLLSSMNKEQIAEQCIKLLSKTVVDDLGLELATVNCVVSNYQETFQNNTISLEQFKLIQERKVTFQKQCQQQFSPQNTPSSIESQLLIGMCVSDRLNQL